VIANYTFRLFLLGWVITVLCSAVFSQKATLGKEQKHYESLSIFKDSIQVKEDAMRTTGKRGTYEWWYFDAHLEDGSKIVIVFFTKPTHKVNGPLKPLCTVDIDWPDGSKIHREYSAPVKNCQFSKKQCDVVIGNNFFRGDLDHYEIHFEDDSLMVDIVLERESPSWRPQTGHWYFGKKQKKFFAWFPAVPQGGVTAEIRYQGHTHKLKGSGYHDHNWYNKNILAMFDHWYWARAELGEYSIILSQMIATKKYDYMEFPIVMIAKNGEIIADNEKNLELLKEEIELDNDIGKPVADRLLFSYQDRENKYKVTFSRDQNIFINKMIESTNGFQKFLAKIMGFDGAYVRFAGEASIEVFENNSLTEQIHDNAIWELMYFGKYKKDQLSTR
jgi:predicted secreted hydrolase